SVRVTITASVAFRNLSRVAADSVIVRYDVTDDENRTTLVAADTVLHVTDGAGSSHVFGPSGPKGSHSPRISLRQPRPLDSAAADRHRRRRRLRLTGLRHRQHGGRSIPRRAAGRDGRA